MGGRDGASCCASPKPTLLKRSLLPLPLPLPLPGQAARSKQVASMDKSIMISLLIAAPTIKHPLFWARLKSFLLLVKSCRVLFCLHSALGSPALLGIGPTRTSLQPTYGVPPCRMTAEQSRVTGHEDMTASNTLDVQNNGMVFGYADGYSPAEDHYSTNLNGPHPRKTATELCSEHGHSLSRIRPMAKHSGAAVSTFFNGLFTTIIGIATLGASITFSYVLSNNSSIPESQNPSFGSKQIQLFLAISWLLFLLALAFASLGSTLLTFFKNHWVADWDGTNGKTSQWCVQMYAVFASGLLGALTVGAFVLLCLVVVAYSAVVGWIALGFTCFFGVVILMAVINQAPWSWRNNTPSSSSRHRSAYA